jgi:uncharacterized protein with von Willebrand factor type A (vWA) domain
VPSSPVVRHIVTFGRVLREAGLEVGPGRVADALKGLDAVELARQDDVYWTLRQTLVSRREDIDLFDRAFHAWFLRAAVQPALAAKPAPQHGERRKGPPPGPGPELDGGETSLGAWSEDELLRTKDFAAMTAEEFARARKLIQAIAVGRPRRRTRRLRPDSKGHALDVRGLVRASLATGGDPVERALRSRTDAPRKLVLILVVSGSMEAYARALLLYLHAARGSGRCRDLRVRHPADTVDAGARRQASRGRVRGSRCARAGLVRRHPHRRLAEGVQRRVGPARADAGRRPRAPLRRLRAR